MKRTAILLLLLSPALSPAGDKATLDRLANRLRDKGDGGAAQELAKLGAPAAPILIQILEKEADARVRTLAAAALGQIGPDAKAAIPVLIDALAAEEFGLCSQAAQALARIGPAAVPGLVQALEKPKNKHCLIAAAEALRHLGPAGKAAVPHLMRQLKDLPPLLSLPLIDALGAIGPEAKAAVPLLIELGKGSALAATDEPLQVHGRAVHVVVALGKIGPAAKEAIPFLAEVMKGKNLKPGDPLQLHALEAIKNIGVPAQDVVPLLLENIKSGKGPQLLYLETLAAIASPDKDSLPFLTKALADRNPHVRLHAARLVGKFTPNEPAVVSVLIESFQEKDAKLRILAAQTMGAIRPRDEAIGETLERAEREDTDPQVRSEAKKALEKLRGK